MPEEVNVTLNSVVGWLVDADELLASRSIDDVKSELIINPRYETVIDYLIGKAEEELNRGLEVLGEQACQEEYDTDSEHKTIYPEEKAIKHFAKSWVCSQIALRFAKGELTIHNGKIVPNILEGWDEEDGEYKGGLGREIIVEVLKEIKTDLVELTSGVQAKVMTHSWNLTEYQQFKKWTHIGTPQNNVTVEFYDEECAMLDHKRLKDYDMVRTECNKTAECITNEEGVCQTNLKPGEYAGLLVYENATKKP